MRIVRSGKELGPSLATARCEGQSIGFVATMGALHQGHLALVDACKTDNDLTVMSIYVNPSQFGPNEDLARYPRDLDKDARLAEGRGVDVLFTPSDAEMYPDGLSAQTTWVDPGPMADVLEGAFRPGHFRGVATVVAKLFNIVRPDRAYFGQKDAHQAAVITHIATQLNTRIEIRVMPTIREADGLALSSRNVFLSPAERMQAPALYRGLQSAATLFATGERDHEKLRSAVEEEVTRSATLARIQYIAVTDNQTLAALTGPVERPALISLSAYFGSTRLIDNIVLTP